MQPISGIHSYRISRWLHPILRQEKSGFTLIITLTLMILLTLLAVGLLTLSTVSLRASAHGMAMAEARANARVSLMLALGQLQQEMGPDRRISAPSGILDSTPATAAFDGIKHPRLAGVWDAADSPFGTRPSLDRPSYDKNTRFRRWLISGDVDKTKVLDTPKSQQLSDTMAVLAPASADPVANVPVSVPLMKSDRGGFAWWTSDNGTKATLRAGEKPEGGDRGKVLLASRRQDGNGHNVVDPRLPTRSTGLDHRLVDLASVDAAMDDTNVALTAFHDLTTQSQMIPVDVSNGGFRQCMNLYLDYLQTQPAALGKEVTTLGPSKIPDDSIRANRGVAATADYRVCAWDQLRNYESLARASGMVTMASGGRPQVRAHKQFGKLTEPEWNPTIGDNRFRIQPVLLKLGMAVSYATERLPQPADPDYAKYYDPTKPFALRLYVYPMLVLWNPYNVDLKVPEYLGGSQCPLTFNINAGASGNQVLDLTKTQTAISIGFGPEMGGTNKVYDQVIPAGTTKVFYPQPVRLDTPQHREEHRHSKFPWVFYIWGQTGKFTLGEAGNYGGVIKNLNPNPVGLKPPYNFDNRHLACFDSLAPGEIWGGSADTIGMSVEPSKDSLTWTFGMAGAHTDWWGNNGSGTDNAETLQKFGSTTEAKMRVESAGGTPQISILKPGEIPTRTFGQLEGKPTPLLYFEFYRKAADEDLFPAKHHSFSVAGNPIHGHTSKELGNNDAITPWFESPYSFRFKGISSWFDVTKTFQLPPDSDERIYFGGSYSPKGQLSVVDQEIPLTPLVSLGQLQHLPLFDFRPVYDAATAAATTIWYGGDYGFHEGRVTQFAQNHAIGNSYASPGIPLNKINQAGWRYSFNVQANHLRTDRSYIANAVLWDTWFCSSMAAQDGVMLSSNKRSARQVGEEFFTGKTPLPNDGMVPARLSAPLTDVLKKLFDSSGRPTKDAYTRVAEYLRVEGGFNVNSVSEEAWTHFLSGLLSRSLLVMESKTGNETPSALAPQDDRFLISRTTLTNAPPADQGAAKEREDRYWNGCREVSADQIKELAQAIVRQVKSRGPFLSTAEFVNRRISSDTALANSGALQSALDDEKVSINAPLRAQTIPLTTIAGKPNYPNPTAAIGSRLQGISGWVTQADLLATLGPSISPRSDTFTIRAMGESRDATGKVTATAWCEALVQRGAAYVDPVEVATTSTTALKQMANKSFGRRFEIVSFRWLNQVEVL